MGRATRALLAVHAIFELGVAGVALLAPARLGAVAPEAVAVARVLGANAIGLAVLGGLGAVAARVPRLLLGGLGCFHAAVAAAQGVNIGASLAASPAMVPHVVLAMLLGLAWVRADRSER